MASPYDQSLLASAPAATRAQMQHGYNLDLATEKPVAPTPPASNSRADLEAYGGHAQSPLPPVPQSYASKTPWYRTKKGILILIVALAIVIAAVVGGAVGGTRKKSSAPAANQQVGGSGSAGVGVGGGSTNTTTSSAVPVGNSTTPTNTTSLPGTAPGSPDPPITTGPNQTEPILQIGVSF